MEEITPELIARMASRIYNESPASASAAPQGMPTVPTSPSLPTDHLPVPPVGPLSGGPLSPPRGIPAVPAMTPAPSVPSVPSVPSAGSVPSVGSIPQGSPSAGAGHLPVGVSPGRSFLSNLGNIPSSGGYPTVTSLTDMAPPSAPSLASGGGSGDGLKAFVQNIRSTNTMGTDHCAPLTYGHLRHGAALGALTQVSGSRPFDVPSIRKDFPVLQQKVHGKPLVWLDNAATTQKPQSVIDAVSHFYENDNSNIHRAAHSLAARSTDAYEKARSKIQSFLGASSAKEIVYVRGTTEGINLVAQTYGRRFLQPGDEIVLSTLEHHANIVPWQMVAQERGAIIRVIPVNDSGEIMLEEYQRIIGPRTKLVAITHASNSLGTILPVAEMTQIAKRYGARVLIDGAQSVAHIPVNVQQLGCDFYVFSGHKIFGPMGIGAVFIKEELHDVLPPWQGGGNMIRNVTFEGTSFSEAPAKFEAGTPNVADAVGLGYALDYVNQLGLSNIAAYEHELLHYATEHMLRINGLRLVGMAREKVGVLSFVLPNYKTEEVGKMLDQEGIAVRSGHHCSQPSLRRFGLEATVRPSISLYNTKGEIDHLVDTIKRIQRVR